MTAPAARRPASPYARRLARERGLALDGVAGSGPLGRIVAADVLAFVVRPAPVGAPAVAVVPTAVAAPLPAPRSIGAFQASIDLGPLATLIAAAGADIPVDAFLVKAAARAAGQFGRLLLLRDASGQAGLIEQAATLAPGEIARRHASGVIGDAPFVVERHDGSGIRPMAGGLAPWALLKLVIVADAGRAELLLVHDETAVSAASAVTLLAAIRDLAESPLRLLV